jgi:hypothetical protein
MDSMSSYDGDAFLSYNEDYQEIPPERALVPLSSRDDR